MRGITKYFIEAITASVNRIIDFKEEKFMTISYGELLLGKIDKDVKIFFNRKKDEEDDSINIIIGLKAVAPIFLNGVKLNDNVENITCLFYIPAILDKDGNLKPQKGKLPWIPNDFLFPFIEENLSIGSSKKYDNFLAKTEAIREEIKTFKEYIDYCKLMYECVTGTKFNEYVVNNIDLTNDIYIFEDKTINSTRHILKLYKSILIDNKNYPLYEKITQMNVENEKPIPNNKDFSLMKKHCGQMGGEFPLSHSQREALNTFNILENGEVLAVNGPPGTGKTTLLQSLVANMYVDRALKEEQPPIIVATSTNNQAVTNIIDSFGNIKATGIKNLESHWVNGVKSFATYFPSKGKQKIASKLKYQYTNINGDNFIEKIDKQLEIEEDDILPLKVCDDFIKECENYFDMSLSSIGVCKRKILDTLRDINNTKNNCIDILECLDDEMKGLNVYDIKSAISDIKDSIDKYFERLEEWQNIYNDIPLYMRIFKFFPKFKRRIFYILNKNLNTDEFKLFKDNLSIKYIENTYLNFINELRSKLIKLEEKLDYIMKNISNLENNFELLKNYNINLENIDITNLLYNNKIEKLNEIFDSSIRYVEFWLAVHYYESRWLLKENLCSKKQRGKTFSNVLDSMYRRLALISPCMVMTSFMLPKNFCAFSSKDQPDNFMYNFIDLLIVDEAGQISTEIGAASFSLAKKAVVVGDENQIPPVWGIDKIFDTSIAVKSGLIKNKKEFEVYVSNGLNCSSSSIMNISSKICPYNKYEQGLFLSEHRRCYDEIISYSNELIYNGHLQPLRGKSIDNEKNPIKNILPAMGYMQINSNNSTKSGTSRINEKEAKEIASWISKNFNSIKDKYEKSSNGKIKMENILGIITPFKRQVPVLKEYLKKECPDIASYISVGTVHTFQGGERNIIIFSSVYGKNDGCYFIDRNKSLMNVAVSRAKDSFLVFGDMRCFNTDENTSSGLLKKYLIEKIK